MNIPVTRSMLRAEVLKLRRNRALMAFAAVLSVGVVVLAFGYGAVEHAAAPSRHPPVGGLPGFARAVKALGLYFGALTAILIGAEAGTADLSSGVFRDLVATGRSRLALFGVRAPAAALVAIAFNAVGFGVSLIATFAFAGSYATPGLGLILQGAAWLVLANVALATLAVGVGSLSGSRALTLTAVIGWQAVATNLLLNVSSLGAARDGLLTPALAELMPVPPDRGDVAMAVGVAIAVVCVWIAVPSLLGAWRSRTQDA